MAERRPGRRVHLRLFSLSGALAACLAMCGCLSMSIETVVDRRGGGTRSYQVEMDPAPGAKARGGAMSLADLGLDEVAGVELVDSSHSVRQDGGTVSRTTCRADDIRKFSHEDDSISLTVTRRGLWTVYRFRESYNLGLGRDDSSAAALFTKNRFRHRLRLPGRIVSSNSDSLNGSWAVWNRPMFAATGRLVMQAESKSLDASVPAAAAALAVALALLAWRWSRKRAAPQAVILLAAALLAAAGTTWAIGRKPGEKFDPEEASQGSIRFYVQAAQFRGIPGRTWVEISYVLPLDNLQFVKADTAYTARYSISAMAFDPRGRQAAGDEWERSLTVGDYASIGRERRVNADTLRLELAPGEYRLKVVCTDNNSDREGIIYRRISVADFFGQLPALGGVRLERSGQDGILPWAQKAYGGDLGPVVVYLRLYTAGPDSVLLDLSLEGRERRGAVASVRETLVVDGTAEVRRLLPVDSLPGGDYLLNLTARTLGEKGRDFHQSSQQVRIRGSGAGGRSEIESSLEVLEYIANRDELRALDRASLSSRDSALDAFWKGRDPTPGTERNEVREDFYQRVEQADRQYSLGIRPGWRTDRGRIYIKYGPPDEIDRHPFEPDNPAYEIWYYYYEGVKFMFMDVHGFGEYRLMNPKAERK